MNVTRMTVVAGWTLALVTGCSSIPSVGPDYKEPEFADPAAAVPDAGQPTSKLTASCEYAPAAAADDRRRDITRESMAGWWKNFNDPILDRLIDGGVSNNVGFLMARQRLEQAEYELLGSYAAFLPKFTGAGEWVRDWYNKSTTANTTGRNGFAYNTQSVALDGSWEIDIFGGSRRASEAAFAMAEAQRWTVSDAWLSLTSQIGAQYINLRTTQACIEVARTNLVLQSETYDILKSRLDSGIGDELAVNQCAYIVDETRARIPQLLAVEEACKNALSILAGELPGGKVNEMLGPVASPRDWLLSPQKVAELKLDLLRARPDVKAAERRLAAQTASIGVAKAQWFPRFFVTGTVGWQSNDRTRIFDRDSFMAALGPQISWPIFQGGAIYANVKATEAKVREAALAYEQTIQNAYSEVRNAYCAYTQEYHRYQALRGAVKAATDAVTISKDLYKNGLRDFNNVLDAQRSRLQYEEEFVRSGGNISIELINLYRALGGGLDVPTERE